MKIFDFGKLAYSKARGKLVKLNNKVCIPKPINSTNCPTIYLGTLSSDNKPSDGVAREVLSGESKVPVCMKTGTFMVKKGDYEDPNKQFLGVRVYLGSDNMATNVLYADIPAAQGVVDSDGNLVFTYDYPVFEYKATHAYYHATYNSDSGEGGQFIQNSYMTRRIFNATDPYTLFKPSITSVESILENYEPYIEINCNIDDNTQNVELYINGNLEETAEEAYFSIPVDYDKTYNIAIRGISYNGTYSKMSDTYTYKQGSDPIKNAKPYIDVTEPSEYGDTVYVNTWMAGYETSEFECYVNDILKEKSTDGDFCLQLDMGTNRIKTRAKNNKGNYSQFSDVKVVTIDHTN